MTTHWRAEWPEVPAAVKVAVSQLQLALEAWPSVSRVQVTFDHLQMRSGGTPPTFDCVGDPDQTTKRRLEHQAQVMELADRAMGNTLRDAIGDQR